MPSDTRTCPLTRGLCDHACAWSTPQGCAVAVMARWAAENSDTDEYDTGGHHSPQSWRGACGRFVEIGSHPLG